MPDTQSSLLRRGRDRRTAASWREFQELYEPLLLNYVRSRGLTEHDARDVVQDVFVLLLPAATAARVRPRPRTLPHLAVEGDLQRRR